MWPYFLGNHNGSSWECSSRSHFFKTAWLENFKKRKEKCISQSQSNKKRIQPQKNNKILGNKLFPGFWNGAKPKKHKITLLPEIPTMTKYFVIISDISSGNKWNICFWHSILAFYLTFFSDILSFLTYLASILTFSLAFFLPFFLAHVLACYLANILAFYFTFFSGILSGTHSGIEFGFHFCFHSRIPFGILSEILFWHSL